MGSANKFIEDVSKAWSQFHFRDYVVNYPNKIIWNNSNIKMGYKTVFYKR